MTGDIVTLVSEDTRQLTQFVEIERDIDQTSMHSTHREVHNAVYYKAPDGEILKRMPDGTAQDRHGTAWLRQH
jgi:hypothetical protein